MSKIGIVAGATLMGVMSAGAMGLTITNNPVADRATLLSGRVPLNLSAVSFINAGPGSLDAANGVYSENFSNGPFYTGTLSVEVFGNVANPGIGLNEVTLIYTFTGNGPSAIEQFVMGLNGSSNLDFADLASATHGRITGDTTFGQGDAVVDLIDNSGGGQNDNMIFSYQSDNLGGPSLTETYTWYVRASGAVAVNFVDVEISDFGFAFARTLTLVDIPGQPDLNVPAPGAAALLGFAGLAASRRRR